MRTLAILFIYMVITPSAKALSAEEQYARAISRARSPSEIGAAAKAFDEIRLARAACRIQLREQSAPLACYETLWLEVRNGLHSSPMERKQLISRLDQICAKASTALKIPRHLKFPLGISSTCQKDIRTAVEIQKYRESSPEWSGN